MSLNVWHKTGRTRSLSATGAIQGTMALQHLPLATYDSAPEFSIGLPLAAVGTSITLTMALTSGTITATLTASDGLGGSDVETWGDDGANPYSYDLAGSWEISVSSVREEVQYTAHASNDTHGFPTYGGAAAPDCPYGLTATFREVIPAGETLTVSCTVGAKSVSVVTALAADTEVNSYRLTIAAESACTKYSDDTSIGFALMGVTAPSYTKSSGYASAIIGTNTVVAQVQAAGTTGGGTAAANMGITPTMGHVCSGIVRSDVDGIDGNVTLRYKRKGGEAYHEVSVGDTYTTTYSGANYALGATLNGTAQTPLTLNEHDASNYQYLVPADSGDESSDWRILYRGRSVAAVDITHATEVTVDGTFSGTGPTAITRTLSPAQRWNGYRYLRVTCDKALKPITLTVGVKEWEGTTDDDGIVTFDLCIPTNLAAESDSAETRWPVPASVDSITGDGSMWGVEEIASYTLTDLESGTTYTFGADAVQLVEADHTLLTCLPSFGKWHFVDDDTSYRRFLLSDTDGRAGMEELDMYRVTSPSLVYVERNLDALIDDMAATDDGYPRHPGWTATIKAAIDIADGGAGTDVEYGWLNKARPATWLQGAGALYSGGEWQTIDLDANAVGTLYAQELIDEVVIYPGIGDAFGHRAGAHQSEYADAAVEGSGLIELRSAKYMRGPSYGIVATTSNVPYASAQVALTVDDTDEPRGVGTADVRGEYRTGYPYGRGGVTHKTALVGVAGTPPSIIGPHYSRYRHRRCFRGAGGAGVSYDVSAAMRHVRAYPEGGTILLQYALGVVPYYWSSSLDTGLAGGEPCIRWARSTKEQQLWLLVTDGGSLKMYRSDNDGRTWSVATTVMTATKGALCCLRMGARYVAGRKADGSIAMVAYDNAGNVMLPEFSAVASGCDDDCMALEESIIGAGVHQLALLYRTGGALTTVVSTDGKTFT